MLGRGSGTAGLVNFETLQVPIRAQSLWHQHWYLGESWGLLAGAFIILLDQKTDPFAYGEQLRGWRPSADADGG